MTEAAVFTEPTTALRDWLRTLSVGDVYAGGLPAGTTTGIVITRVGGAWISPVDVGLYQLDCWATKASTAAGLASALITALEAAGPVLIVASTEDVGGLRFKGLGAVSLLSLSDPSAPDRYRTVVTAELPTVTIPSTP